MFPIGEFIADEMKARGWTFADVAERMGGITRYERDVDQCTVELIVACGEDRRLGLSRDTAEKLARAFGTTPELWINLHDSWRAQN